MTITKQILYRPIWISVFIIGVTLIVGVAVLVGTSWRSIQRLKPIHAHLNHVNTIQQTSLDLQEMLFQIRGGRRFGHGRLEHARATIGSLMKKEAYLTDGTQDDLRRIYQQLTDIGSDALGKLPQILGALRHVITAETLAKDRLLEDLDRDTHAELVLSTAIIFTLPVVGLLLVFFMRRRIFEPLGSLGHLMTLLAEQDFRTMPTEQIDPLLQPLFGRYNYLVERLTTLEDEHRMLQRSLEHQVRDATQSLLAQQMTLSRAERLAAMGEVAAGLAHELRNPLAGVQMALGNLREDLSDPEQAQRLELMITELKRVMQLLNGLLGQSLVAPEPATEIALEPAVEDLLTLMRYQVPETIQLRKEIAPGLSCRLPKNSLHQALLNLLMNAAQALGDGPGRIDVTAKLEDGRLRLSVQDDGPGFPKELLQVGARPFVTWRDEGTGLGLTMVRRFAQDLGGELSLANLERKGARVTIDLPCKERDA